MITAKDITKKFEVDTQVLTALEDINFQIKREEFTAIVGPSGCGKSTLLRIIAGLQKPTSGKIIWEIQPKIGFVFQNYALFPYLTVYQNIEFGLKMLEIEKKQRKETIDALIEEMGLKEFADKHPKELSGGMKQRVGIARSLAIDPNILLLDEPFSSLDEFTAENLRKLLLDIWQKRKITILMVTHLIQESLELSDRIIVMESGPGRIKDIVTNSLKRPRNLRGEDFYVLEDKLTRMIRK